MKTSLIQSQLTINRTTIRRLHSKMNLYFEFRSEASHLEDEVTAEYYHKSVLSTRKKIAKLVKLQKALKKDLAREIAYERAARVVHSLKVSCMANVGETW